MDRPAGLSSRWGKRYFRNGSVGSKEESKYLLLDDNNDNDDDVVFVSSKVRGRKSNKTDPVDPEGDEILVPVPGRPPARPPNDQCVEAEIQPEDTLASISLKVLTRPFRQSILSYNQTQLVVSPYSVCYLTAKALLFTA